MERVDLPYDELKIIAGGQAPAATVVAEARATLQQQGWCYEPVVAFNLDGSLHALNPTTPQLVALHELAKDWDFEGDFTVPMMIIGYEEAFNLCQAVGMDWDGFLALPMSEKIAHLHQHGYAECAQVLATAL
ncbi:hypothetical protein [Magnetococcus marinus]|nr:hypothetical protein [Magnetococcus marinus]